jgi:uncharacterized protein (TIGR00730 family)
MKTFRRLCVYCGSSTGNDPAYKHAAAKVGETLARQGIGVVYGGGHVGLMGVLADAALAAGGEVIGVIPVALQQKELGHSRVTELHVVDSMHERKQMMADLADGFISLPGGIGTLEELFETFTWLQLGYHHKPVGLLNVGGFYNDLLVFLEKTVRAGLLKQEHLDSLIVAEDLTTLLKRMNAFSPASAEKWITARQPEER